MTAPAPTHGGFTEPAMREMLRSACAAAGLDPSGALVLRSHSNAVVRLVSAPVVVKIARRGSSIETTGSTVALVRWLADRGFPTVALHPGVEQPVLVDGHTVTFWTYLPQPDLPVTACQLGGPLRMLHALPMPPFAVRELDAIAAIRFSLAASTALSGDESHFLAERADVLERQLAGLRYTLRRAVLHGDPQHRNALHTGDGRIVLCDWESAVLGPPEWDLVTVEIHCRRFGYPLADYREFADVYGFDVTKWSDYPILRDVRELRMITTNARKSSDQPAKLAEVRHRIAALRRSDTDQRWQIL